MKSIRVPLAFAFAVFLVLGTLSIRSGAVQVEEKPFFARLIGPETLGFVHVPWDSLADSPVAKLLSKEWGNSFEQMEKSLEEEFNITSRDLQSITFYIDNPIGWVFGDKPLPPVLIFLVEAKKVLNKEAILGEFDKTRKMTKIGRYECWIRARNGMVILDDKRMLRLEIPPLITDLKTELMPIFSRLEKSHIPEAMQSAVKLAQTTQNQAVFGFQIPEDLRDFVLVPQNQAKTPVIANFPKPLLEMNYAVGTVDFGHESQAEIVVKGESYYLDEAKARASAGMMKSSIAMNKMMLSQIPTKDIPEMSKIVEATNKLFDGAEISCESQRVKITYRIGLDYFTTLLPAIKRARALADRLQSANNMRQLSLAMLMHSLDYAKKFPSPAITDKNGKPLLSWRVKLLPYVELDELYLKFKRDEPWDSPHNKSLLDNTPMPKVFEHPAKRDGEKKLTYYKVFVSKNGISPAAGFTFGQQLTSAQLEMEDGPANTIAMVEAGPPVIWTKPEDIDFDPSKPFPKLISVWDEPIANVAFFDGKVRTAKIGIHEDVWKGLVTRNGGEKVDFGKIEK